VHSLKIPSSIIGNGLSNWTASYTGQILLDGYDLKDLDLKWLRKQIGLVNQELSLFAMTVADNIMYGTDNASQEEIEEAARMANIHSFIMKLPSGYQTQVCRKRSTHAEYSLIRSPISNRIASACHCISRSSGS
jgi:ABC-type multidrug transport system fused ATPase/permease subunit